MFDELVLRNRFWKQGQSCCVKVPLRWHKCLERDFSLGKCHCSRKNLKEEKRNREPIDSKSFGCSSLQEWYFCCCAFKGGGNPSSIFACTDLKQGSKIRGASEIERPSRAFQKYYLNWELGNSMAPNILSENSTEFVWQWTSVIGLAKSPKVRWPFSFQVTRKNTKKTRSTLIKTFREEILPIGFGELRRDPMWVRSWEAFSFSRNVIHSLIIKTRLLFLMNKCHFLEKPCTCLVSRLLPM